MTPELDVGDAMRPELDLEDAMKPGWIREMR